MRSRATLRSETHTAAITALHLSGDQMRLYSGDAAANLVVWKAD
jgi:hypothetical protein